jgi:hypothetical protein
MAFSSNVTKWAHIVEPIAKKYGMSPDIAYAIMTQESGGNSKAVSNVGAFGLMQVMPSNYKAYGYTMEQAKNPEVQVQVGVDMFMSLVKRHGGIPAALAAYNGGTDGLAYFRSGMNPEAGRSIHLQRKAKGSYFDYRQVDGYVRAITPKLARLLPNEPSLQGWLRPQGAQFTRPKVIQRVNDDPPQPAQMRAEVNPIDLQVTYLPEPPSVDASGVSPVTLNLVGSGAGDNRHTKPSTGTSGHSGT